MLNLVENKRVKLSDIELKDRLVGVQRVVKKWKEEELDFHTIVVVGDEKSVVGIGLENQRMSYCHLNNRVS